MIFAKMDHAIFQALWRWAKRRHPKKPPGWRRRKYFTRVANNHWVFFGTTTTSRRKTQELKRHCQLKEAIFKALPLNGSFSPGTERRIPRRARQSLLGDISLPLRAEISALTALS